MPRIYNSASEPLDFCDDHWPTEDEAFELYGDVGDGPDGRGNCFAYDADHPDYGDGEYFCEVCDAELIPPRHSSWVGAMLDDGAQSNVSW